MLMNAKLHDALCVAVIALLGLFLGAVRSNEVMITSENKVLAFDQTELTIGTFEFFCSTVLATASLLTHQFQA